MARRRYFLQLTAFVTLMLLICILVQRLDDDKYHKTKSGLPPGASLLDGGKVPAAGNRFRTVSSRGRGKLRSPYIATFKEHEQCMQFQKSSRKVLPQRLGNPNVKLIVYWQDHPLFPVRSNFHRELCTRPTAGPCEITFDARYHSSASAVVFHASRIFDDRPPFEKKPGQVWVARGMEAPCHWTDRGYRSPRWKGVFNWTMTIRPDADLFAPVGVLYRLPGPPPGVDYKQIAQRKTRSVAWFVSDCDTESRREEYVEELRKHIDVDIFGECGRLQCPRKDPDCDAMLSDKYRYYLSFENSICPHYVTEKFFNKYRDQEHPVHLVPIVRGGFDYRKYIPDGTYINAADFASPKRMAGYLIDLGRDPDAYAAMLQRKSLYAASLCLKSEPWCKLCDRLHEESVAPKVYDDLPRWVQQPRCTDPQNVTDFLPT